MALMAAIVVVWGQAGCPSHSNYKEIALARPPH
jgi:hypothetical protein